MRRRKSARKWRLAELPLSPAVADKVAQARAPHPSSAWVGCFFASTVALFAVGVVSSVRMCLDSHRAIATVWKMEAGKLIGGLTRMVRDVGLAEDLAQE